MYENFKFVRTEEAKKKRVEREWNGETFEQSIQYIHFFPLINAQWNFECILWDVCDRLNEEEANCNRVCEYVANQYWHNIVRIYGKLIIFYTLVHIFHTAHTHTVNHALYRFSCTWVDGGTVLYRFIHLSKCKLLIELESLTLIHTWWTTAAHTEWKRSREEGWKWRDEERTRVRARSKAKTKWETNDIADALASRN